MPPAVRGMGNAGGWKLYLQDRGDVGLAQLEQAAGQVIGQANQSGTNTRVFTFDAMAAMESLLAEVLPEGVDYEWTELALQEKLAGNTVYVSFGLAVVFVFLLLAALYESWLLPLAVILIVPMCLLAAVTGISLRGIDNNVLVQIGFIVLIGLASKNAILIVEFAKQAETVPGPPGPLELIQSLYTSVILTCITQVCPIGYTCQACADRPP